MNDSRKRYGVVVHHPSRVAAAEAAYAALRARLARERPRYLMWCLEDPQEQVIAFAAKVPRGEVFQVVPLLFAPGTHYKKDVQGLAAAVRTQRPDLDVKVCPPLLQDEHFVGAWLGRL